MKQALAALSISALVGLPTMAPASGQLTGQDCEQLGAFVHASGDFVEASQQLIKLLSDRAVRAVGSLKAEGEFDAFINRSSDHAFSASESALSDGKFIVSYQEALDDMEPVMTAAAESYMALIPLMRKCGIEIE